MTRHGRAALVSLCVLASFTHADAQTRGCSVLQQNLFVRDVMSDIYLWHRQIPEIDPAQVAGPEAYLDSIRFRPIDATFSYITSRVANEALFSSSEYIGLGFSSAWAGDDLRITQVFPGSPAQEVGLLRGDVVTAVNGRSVPELVGNGEFAGAFGPAEHGFGVDLIFVRGGVTMTGHLVKRSVVIPTVSHTRVIDRAGRRVGYVFFRNFVQPSVGALDQAFAEMRRQRVDELVLDLRYNGGGLVTVAQHLAGLIGGALTNGQVFAEYVHNDRNPFLDRTLRFGTPDNALALDRVLVITTRASASASELVINALRPFMPVVVVGERTYGKPVGQYSVTFCDKVLAPVSFALRNARGEGSYFDGLQPTCTAADGLNHAIGDEEEASLREALIYIETGACTPTSLRPRLAQRASQTLDAPAGWAVVLGAH